MVCFALGVAATDGLTNLEDVTLASYTFIAIEEYELVRVVRRAGISKKLLLPRQIGQMSSNLVAVGFGLQERHEVDARPHLLAR
jgi:hypothetical protein